MHPEEKKKNGVLLPLRDSLQEALEFGQKIKPKCKSPVAFGVGT